MLKDRLLTMKTDNEYPTDDLNRMTEITGSIVCQCAGSLGKLACAGFIIDGDTIYMVFAHNENEYSVMSRQMTGLDVIDKALEDMQFVSCFIARREEKGFHILTPADFGESD